MNSIPTPVQTPLATRWLACDDARIDRVERTLLANIDGNRNLVELESFARAIGLAPDALERLRCQGLIELAPK